MEELRKLMNGSAVSIGLGIAVALAIFWFGGWKIAWGEPMIHQGDFYLDRGVAIRFNYQFYGLLFTDRFFSSKIVAWLLGGLACFICAGVLGFLNDTDSKETGEPTPKS